MKPLADLRRAVATAACLAIAPAPFWPRIERAALASVRACGLGTAEQRARAVPSAAAAVSACARFARALRAVAATLAEAEDRALLLALAEDLDPL
jgi:hypothetical protein